MGTLKVVSIRLLAHAEQKKNSNTVFFVFFSWDSSMLLLAVNVPLLNTLLNCSMMSTFQGPSHFFKALSCNCLGFLFFFNYRNQSMFSFSLKTAIFRIG